MKVMSLKLGRRQDAPLDPDAARRYAVTSRQSILVKAPARTVYEAATQLVPQRESGPAKTTTTLRVKPIDYQTSRVYTETRVHIAGRPAWGPVRLYWRALCVSRALLWRGLLRQVKQAAEQATGLFLLTPAGGEWPQKETSS